MLISLERLKLKVSRNTKGVKKWPWQLPHTKANILKSQNWAKKYIKIDFSKVIFMDKSRVTFDGHDGWAKGWVLFNSDVLVVKIRQQEDGNVMIWVWIVDQTMIVTFKDDERIKLKNAVAILWIRISFRGSSPRLIVSKWSVHLWTAMFLLTYLSLLVNSLKIKDLYERR